MRNARAAGIEESGQLRAWSTALALSLCLAGGARAQKAEPATPAAEKPAEKEPVADQAAARREKKAQAAQKRQELFNQVQQWLRGPGGMIPGQLIPAPAVPAQPVDPAVQARKSTGDPRAPADPKFGEILRKAESALKAGETTNARKLLELALQWPQDSLFRTQSGEWVGGWDEARRMLKRLPADEVESFVASFAGLAEQQLAAATAQGDVAGMMLVARRFSITPSGQAAADRVGDQLRDRGEYGLAARWYRSLWELDAPLSRTAAWRMKAAATARLAGELEFATLVLTPPGKAEPNLQALWQKLPAGAATTPEALADWPMFFGNPTRSAVSSGGEPLLLRRWSAATTSVEPVARQIRYAMEDLRDQGLTPLSTFAPLMVDGKVVFRSLRGVKVVSAADGKLLWETADPLSAERLFFGLPEESFEGPEGVAFQVMNQQMQYYGQGADQQPLMQALLRNANYGVVNSDGRRLYVIEDQLIFGRQPGQYSGEEASEADQFGRSWSSNRLAAYDLQTGRSLWEAGGPESVDPFAAPLAGQFFLGAPVADDGALFVVAEKDNEIRLFRLDPQAGREEWSQLLAYSEAKIAQDVGRQWWTSQPAVGQGVVVCPTTVGWLVAVDRRRPALLWAYRYAPPHERVDNENFNGGFTEPVVQYTGLNDQWAAAPPVISGRYVVFTPPEHDALVCLNLFTGQLVWSKPRDMALYLAGVWNGQVVTVGRDRIQAVKLESGAEAWQVPFGDEGRRPAGRGTAVDGRYYLPLTNGELWTIDLASGQVVQKAFLPSPLPAVSAELGNLTMYQGMLFSMHPLGITAFEQRESVERDIQARLAARPDDPGALLRRAEIAALHHDFAGALAGLRPLAAATVPDELQPRLHALQVAALTAVVRSDFQKHDDELAALVQLAQTPDERRGVARLTAERLAARGETPAAFAAFLALVDQVDEVPKTVGLEPLRPAESPFVTVGATHVRLEEWVAGELGRLWAQAAPEHRTELDASITARAAGLPDLPARERFRRLFSFHPAARDVVRETAAAWAGEKELVRSEQRWLELTRDPARARDAWLALAALYESAALPGEAAVAYQRLLEVDSSAVTADGQPASAKVIAAQAAGHLPGGPSPIDWHDADVQVTKAGLNYNSSNIQNLSPESADVPFYRTHRIQLHYPEQRFVLMDALHETPLWQVPLRGRSNAIEEGFVAARTTAHQVIVLHRGVVHCLSPVERRLLWTHTLDERPGATPYYIQPFRPPVAPLRPLSERQQIRDAQLHQDVQFTGPLLAATTEYVCYRGRRRLVVLDAATGAVRWTRDRFAPEMVVYGGPDVLYLIHSGGGAPLALDARDGRELPSPLFRDSPQAGLCWVGNDLVVDGETRPGQPVELQRVNPVSNAVAWKAAVAAESFISPIAPETLAVIEPAGKVRLLDLRTGGLRDLGTLDKPLHAQRRDSYVFADYDSVYVVANGSDRQGSFFSNGIPAVNVQGDVYAFDPVAGKVRWKQSLTGLSLLTDRIAYSPILVLTAQKFIQRKNTGHWQVDVVALDKHTGRKVYEGSPASQPGFQGLHIDLGQPAYEIRTYNERIRLSPAARAASSSEEK